MTSPRRGIIHDIEQKKGRFTLAFMGIFVLTFMFLSVVGATPDPAKVGTEANALPTETTTTPTTISTIQDAPVRVVAQDVGLDVSVSNPLSTNVEVLDHALLSGAVRYPTSGMLGPEGTVLLFGHSSYLPVVHNQAYKAFDNIQNLKPGQYISVYSVGMEYRYSVVSVRVADATQDAIGLDPQGRHLKLVTCDSFVSKKSRFVVSADFVGAYSLR